MKGHILCLLAGRTEIFQMKKLNFPVHTLYYLCILTVKIHTSGNINENKLGFFCLKGHLKPFLCTVINDFNDWNS